MYSSNHYDYFGSWIDKPNQDPATDLLTDEFVEGVRQLMRLTSQQSRTVDTGHKSIAVNGA